MPHLLCVAQPYDCMGYQNRRKRPDCAAGGSGDTSSNDLELESADLREQLARLTVQQAELATPIVSSGSTYNMDSKAEKLRLCADLWSKPGMFEESLVCLRESNPALCAVLYQQIANESTPSDSLRASKQNLVDGTLINIVRAQSQKKTTLISAALSILAENNQNAIAYNFRTAVASEGLGICAPYIPAPYMCSRCAPYLLHTCSRTKECAAYVLHTRPMHAI